MHEEMEASIEELLNEAIMSEVPLVIVEGADDIPFYQMLAQDARKNIDVVAVENIYGYREGCDNVINAIRDIQSIILQREVNKNYILGIIDRDSRFYRNDTPNLICLFILKYYSYESHLANKFGLVNILPKITSVSQRMIDESVLRFVEKDLEKEYKNLFYISLEALKVACSEGYSGAVRYKEKAGKIFAKDYINLLLSKIEDKKQDLERFSNEHNITIGDLKYIAKGKWYLYVYTDSTFKNIRELTNACREAKINQCQYCKVGKYDKCQFKVKNNFQLGQVISMLLTTYEQCEIEYIKERINILA